MFEKPPIRKTETAPAEPAGPVCTHGLALNERCEQCETAATREQQSWRTTRRLQSESKFNRKNRDQPVTEVEINGEKFSIESIESGEHPDLTEVQGLFERTFGEEEVDPEEILRSAVEGKTPWGTEDVRYRVFVIKDASGKVVSTVTGGNLDLLDDEGRPTGKTMFMVAYAVTDKEARQGGLAREAYISAIQDAAIRAQREGKQLGFAAGECTYTSEKFWNKVGWKRVYTQVPGEDNKYEETKYVQPPLDFDEETGEAAEDAGEAPEHLMIDGFGAHTPSKEEVKQTVRAFYDWNNRWPPEAFANEGASQVHENAIDGYEEAFAADLDRNGQLILLTLEDREKARQEGLLIKDHVAADHGQAGQEDF